MDREPLKDNKQEIDIDLLIEKLSNSAIGFRNTTGDIIFKRLRRLFQAKQKQITRDSRLKEIFPESFNEADWKELEKIGLRIPELKRSKTFDYLSVTYLAGAFGSLLIFSILNLNLVFVVWGLPIFGFIMTLAASPMLLFLLVFKRQHFPCDTVQNLVDQIISANWTDLITDDKKLFKEILQQESEYEKRINLQHDI
jgi:hypothetical protein